MSTTTDRGANRVRALRNILSIEASNGFANKAVAGGLDRFLATLQEDAGSHPAITSLAEHGLLVVGYAGLSTSLRSRWATETARLIGPASNPRTKPAVKRAPRPPSPTSSIGLDDPTHSLKTVNRPNANKLLKIGVRTVRDLVYHFPHRHLDYSKRRTISRLQADEEQTIVATLWEAHDVRLGKGGRLRAAEAIVGDDTGNIRVVWFGQPWLAQTLDRAINTAAQTVSGTAQIVLSGRVSVFNGRQQMESPEWELLEDRETADLVHTGRLVPVYPSTDGMPTRTLRRIVREALDALTFNGQLQVDDYLPDAVLRDVGLMSFAQAIDKIHYPDSEEVKEAARRRIAFDEFLVLQLAVASRRNNTDTRSGINLEAYPRIARSFIDSLPFRLTPGQTAALDDAMAEVESAKKPMSRLLQGDVGSGKTVVALAMLLTAVAAGYQGAMMAPTEVLAEQHFLNIRRLLAGLDQPITHPDWFAVHLDGRTDPVAIGLLTGSTKAAARRELGRMVADGILDILVGTHALIQLDVEVPNLALGVVDEQHRFGVMQRAALRGKGLDPHLLLMSATPIPRTLALTVYGDLDVSTMPELPKGRKAIMTRMIPPSRVEDAERFLVEQVREGRQCFVVCPLIDESETILARAAVAEHERLRTTTLAELRVGLLHGRMPLAEKQSVMEAFREAKLDVLVTTPVIEVGIDVPNATVMMIQGANRFGLAQLHQLRGRVGRGEHQSYCFLLAESLSDDAHRRLDVLVRTNDGFEIAEADLLLRGPGDFFGTRQSGLPALRMARLDDRDLLMASRDKASSLLTADPTLATTPALRDAVQRYTTAVTDEVA